MKKSLLVFLLLACGAWSGCAALAPLPADPQAARLKVLSQVPLGTPVAEAQRRMEAHGFHCQIVRPPFAKKTTLSCYINGLGFIVSRDWIVNFEIDEDRVQSLRVVTGLTGP